MLDSLLAKLLDEGLNDFGCTGGGCCCGCLGGGLVTLYWVLFGDALNGMFVLFEETPPIWWWWWFWLAADLLGLLFK